jgi:hypothetical protein
MVLADQAPSDLQSITGFVPLVSTVSGTERVIGFGQATMTSTVPPPYSTFPVPVRITMLQGYLVPVNATAIIQPMPTIDPQDLTTIWNMIPSIQQSIQAPALIR